MPTPGKAHPTQHIGGTILVVMMEVDPAHEDEFNRWNPGSRDSGHVRGFLIRRGSSL